DFYLSHLQGEVKDNDDMKNAQDLYIETRGRLNGNVSNNILSGCLTFQRLRNFVVRLEFLELVEICKRFFALPEFFIRDESAF
ncbi:hypothetical protein Tco_1273995, partial [Tanacetum coccineum]